ncbi:MAG: outer-membrane lipoprotein carrier protein LolA [Bacteriovoracaceae bacterium]|nr:outer-membrane lipoprotein carrier protein LolA [Bacteriovoracaceae bacterium]
MKNLLLLLICVIVLIGDLRSALSGSADFMPKSLKIEFEQSFKSVTGKTKTSNGFLEYKRSSQIRIKESKDNSEFVSNKETSWYYVPPFKTGEKGSVQINNSKNNNLVRVFDSLKNGLIDNDLYKVTEVKVDQFSLKFIDPKSKDLKVDHIDLFFRKIVFPDKVDHKQKNTKVLEFSDLESLSINYTDGQKVDLKLSKIEENNNFPDKNFEFQIPTNTEIIKN